ncbi:hypothetical protein NQZ68_017449 [Dissostichus eleginoides]|nr:hypothetical protein NQZ68_017449 [Dissostichus eleginoides]
MWRREQRERARGGGMAGNERTRETLRYPVARGHNLQHLLAVIDQRKRRGGLIQPAPHLICRTVLCVFRPGPGAGAVVTECAKGELQEGGEEGEPEGGGRLERLEAAEEVKEEEKEEER